MTRSLVLKGGPLDGQTVQVKRPTSWRLRRIHSDQPDAFTHQDLLGRYNMTTGEWEPLEDQSPGGMLIIDTSDGAKALADKLFNRRTEQ
jgi:hypothetical protein